MLYIHHISCVSPQQTFSSIDIDSLKESSENKLMVIEPSYEGIPTNVLRRMGKAVRISVGAALPLIHKINEVQGVIIGTANGGMEDCIKFMQQIVQYDEGLLTPGNFVQSTPNGLAAQIALLKNNKTYNITHVHRGLSFEYAIIDAAMMLKDFPENTYLLGTADEISSYNYNFDFLAGWYKKETISNKELYSIDSPGSIAGEGAVMMNVSSNSANAIAKVQSLKTWHSEDENVLLSHLSTFLKDSESPDLLISGENGDDRLQKYYSLTENLMDKNCGVIRFKHMSGEYPTASSLALWLATQILQGTTIPKHSVKKESQKEKIKTILIYNTYKGLQHSLMLVTTGN